MRSSTPPRRSSRGAAACPPSEAVLERLGIDVPELKAPATKAGARCGAAEARRRGRRRPAQPRPVCRPSRCCRRAGFSCSAACWARAWRPLWASVHAARATRLRRFRRTRVALYHPLAAASIFDELARTSTCQGAPTHPACETAAAWRLLLCTLRWRIDWRRCQRRATAAQRSLAPRWDAVRRGACAPLDLTRSESRPAPQGGSESGRGARCRRASNVQL